MATGSGGTGLKNSMPTIRGLCWGRCYPSRGRIGRSAYRGCPFLNLATEFPDENHPGRAVARANKDELVAQLATIVARLGVGDPNRSASDSADHQRRVRHRTGAHRLIRGTPLSTPP